MEAFAAALMTIATASWVGAIIFQSAVVAPTVFVDLDTDSARRFLRTLFPRFYRLGIACGTLLGVGVILLVVSEGWSGKLLTIAIAAATMLLLDIVSLRLVPRLNAARDAGQAGTDRFSRLHRQTVLLTVVILALGLLVLALIGTNATNALVV